MCGLESITSPGRVLRLNCQAGRWALLAALLVAGSRLLAADTANHLTRTEAAGLEQKWGIEVTSLHLSANGYMVDFRYKVLDPGKAAALADPKAKPYIVDQATGAKLVVPRSPKVGPLRQSAESLTPGKVYFALFSNARRAVKPGSKVTVVIGDFKAENLAVQ